MIPANITHEHIIKAINEIAENGIPQAEILRNSNYRFKDHIIPQNMLCPSPIDSQMEFI